MADDVASIGIAVETTQVQAGIKSLEVLAEQGPKVEKAMAGVEGAATKTGKSLKTLGDGAGKGLDDIGKTAPKAAEGVGRVAKSADDAKKALAGIGSSAANLGQVSSAAAASARGMAGFSAALQSSQKTLFDLQAQVRAAAASVAQLGGAVATALPSMQAVVKAQSDAAKSALDMGAAFKGSADQMRAYSASSAGVADASAKTARSLDATATAARAFTTAMAVAGVGFGANELIAMVDGYTKFTAQLKLATKGASDYGVAMVSVKRIATDAQQGLGEVGTLYARIANGTAELGLNQRKLADITETVSLALKVSGATASESSSAMLQLSQAFASGVLRGEEFNSVNEAAPRLMKALADGINVPVGALRKMAEEGKLTSAVLSEALPKALGQLREEAKEVQTIGGAFTVLKNNIMEMVGAQSNASGTTKAFASGINALANNLDLLAAAGGAVAVVLGARFAASITASGVAFAASAVQAARYQAALASMAGVSTTAAAGLVTVGAAARGASAAMTLLGGPVGAVLTAVGLAATAFYTFGSSAGELAKSVGGLNQPLDDLKKRLDALPSEKRVAIVLDIKEEAVKKAKEAESSFDNLAASMVGAFSGARAASADSARQVNDLVGQLESAKKTGADMTPILRDAARAAGVSNATLKTWLDLAANMRAAREAAKTGEQLPDVVGAGGGRGSINPPTVGEIAANARAQAAAALEATKAFKSQAEQMAEVRKQGDSLRSALKALENSSQGTGAKAQELRDRLAGVDERLKSLAKRGRESAGAAKAEQSAYESLVATINAKIAANDAELFAGGRLSDSEKLRIQLQAQLESGSRKMSAAHKAEALQLLDKLKSQEQEEKSIKRAITLNDQQLAMRQEQAEAEAEMQRRVDAVRMSLHSYTESVKDSVEMTELELRTIGMTNAERTVLIEQLRIEQDLRKRIQEIQNAPYQSQEARQADIDKATAAALQAKLNAQRRVFVSEWDKTSQMVSDTLTDYIMRGGENAAEYLKRLFSTLVLQPIVQYGVSSLFGMGGQAASVASGGLNPLSMLSGGKSAMGLFGGGAGAGFMNGLGAWGSGGSVTGVLTNPGLYTGAELLGTVAPILLGGFALMKILSGDWFGSRGPNHSGGVASTATTDRDLAVKQVLGTDAWGNTLGDFTTRKNEALDKQLQKTVNGMLEMYKALAKIGGGGAREIDIAAGFSTNPKYADEGVYGYFQILDKVTGEVLKKYKNRDMDRDPEKAWAQFVADMGGELVNEIKKGDIPGWMREELDALGEDVTVEGLNAAIQKIAVIDAAFKGWADTMTSFAGLTAKAQTELLKFSGGIEALAGNVNAFYAGFYSEQERAEILQRQVRDQLKKLGVVDIDPAGGEEAKKKFRALIEQALASGNTELAAKLLALAQLFGIAADSAQKSAEAAADAAKSAADEAARALEEAKQKAKDAALANFEAAVQREQEYWQRIVTDSQAAVQAISSILTPLKQSAKELFGSIDAAQQMQAVQGMVYIEQALAGVRGGAKLSSFDGLTDAITAARGGITSGRYASQFERDRDALVLANQLSQIAGYGDTQLSVEERQLKNSQEQLQRLDKTLTYWRDLLDGNKSQIDATLSVEAAIKALEALLFPEKPTTTGGGGGGKTPTPDWGGGGGGGFQPANSGKYKTPTAILGGGAVIYDYAAPDYEKRLDSLAPTFEKYRGTGDFAGLADDFRAAGGTAKDLAYLYGFSEADVLAALDRNGIPRFDVGTNRVPQDMLAMVHKNEAIVPAAFNPWAGGAGLQTSSNERLEALVTQLVADNRAQAGQIVRLQSQIAKLLQRWDGDGLPGQRKEEVTT
ncbi:tape measure protein [Delftia acidovorans]|uniref:tape measure protein n=1 Tax=Delftia acidovorans TaxID=80866 RepID=UPI003018E07E